MEHSLLQLFLQQQCLVGSHPTNDQLYRVNGRVLRERFNIELNNAGLPNTKIDVFVNMVLQLIPGAVYRELREGYVFDGITMMNDLRTVGADGKETGQLRQERNKRYYEKRKEQMAKGGVTNVFDRFVELYVSLKTQSLGHTKSALINDELDRLSDLMPRDHYLRARRLADEVIAKTNINVGSNTPLARIPTESPVPSVPQPSAQPRLKLKIITPSGI